MRPVSTYLRARALVRLCATLAIALALITAARSSRADEAAARAHFKKGIELYDKKQYPEALAAFQEAYREKPSAGIKQNIALSLKGMKRLPEAATALDEALDEGQETLKPETRAAIEHELAELSKSVATVNLSVVTADKQPALGAVVTILAANAPPGTKPRPLAPGALRRPIRLEPGIYTFAAHADGFPDPPEKKLALVSGPLVDAAFVLSASGGAAAVSTPAPVPLGPNEGYLKIESNVPDAAIRVDGVELPHRGVFSGKVAAGTHNVEITAPGWKTTKFDVNVPEGAAIDHPVKLQAIGEAPPEYVAPVVKPPKKKKFYVAVAGALDTASYRLGVPLGAPAPYGTRRSNFAGLTIGGRFGYLLARTFSIELLAELGGMGAVYKRRPGDAVDSQTTIAHWQLTPMARFMTPGKVRFATGAGFGLHGLAVHSRLAQVGDTLTKNGGGTGFSLLVDAGVQIDVGPLYLEIAAFLNFHGVGPVRDHDEPEGRFFYASPATRGGLRLGLGIPF